MSAHQGLLISFDGLDSSGKATQTRQLADRLKYNGWTVRMFQTPDYSTESGKELKLRLQNKLGNWQDTPWQEKMGYFAKNRAEHRDEVIAALEKGEVVIYDRYVPSSLTFIAVEALRPQEADLRRNEIHEAVRQEEYRNNTMPLEDASVFLDMPPRVSAGLLEKRKEILQDDDEYTDHLHVQERLYNEYDYLTKSDPEHYLRIRCIPDGELLGIDDTAELVWEGLMHRFPRLKR